jgi:transposase
MNSAPSITLTDEERTKLLALATSIGARALRKRAQAILACDKGKNNLVVANEIGITNLTVGRWRREFLLNRLKDFGLERRGRPLRALTLSSAERSVLQGWLRSPRGAALLAIRARVILACARGKSNIAVAIETGVSELTVCKLRKRFLSHRLIGLEPQKPGRPAAQLPVSSDERLRFESVGVA